jgi:hypothetical protein
MIRLAIGRALLWLIEPAETTRDEPIRARSIARRQAYEEKARRERPEKEAITAAFQKIATKLQA